MNREEQIKKAAELGTEAFNSNKGSAPCQCPEIENMIEGRKVGETPEGEATTIEIFKSFNNAWMDANLSAPVA